MKKIITTLLIALGIYSTTYAQSKNDVVFGANIGYNSSYVTESNSNYNSAAVSGFNVGLSADLYFSDRWSLKVKATYDQKGWGDGFYTDNAGNSIDGVNFRLNYITVPVMANWHFARTRNWYLNFGPYAGFLVNAKESTDDIDVKEAFNSVDFGLALGIGVKFPITEKTKFFIELDGQAGVSDTFKNLAGPNVTTERSSVNIGVSF